MEISTELVYPYASTPPRIALDVAEALARCPAISRVTLFGSLASRTHDGWSDIDVMCVTAGQAGAWEAVRLLREAMPLRWFGPFADLPQPSGRYWPYGESLFHSVDLSFRTAEAHARVLREGFGGVSVVTRDLLFRDASPSPGAGPGVETDTGEYAFTHALYAATKAMKEYLRSAGEWVDVSARMDVLETEARLLPRRPSGGRPEDVLDEARSLYQRLLMERLRFGAGGGS
ncbi:MAG: nucleotidyltransferase domain-containing protein [Chloroflexi bacterium]|nr:nucleotidyltransferase domain-containing protein [Chloroflexota bacterium]